MCKFRKLNPDEIDCRISTITEKGCNLLLYKDARCDMAILDETVGSMGWMRTHSRDNANCTVHLWDEEKQQWVGKEDVGVESYTEKEKGLASDSFKRACFNWGIGRELYTAPRIWVNFYEKEAFKNSKGYLTTYTTFNVKSILYDEKGHICSLVIIDKKGNIRYEMGKKVEVLETSNVQETQNNDTEIQKTTTVIEKKWINEKNKDGSFTKEYQNCIKGIMEGKINSVADIRKHYAVSKDIAEKLQNKIDEYKAMNDPLNTIPDNKEAIDDFITHARIKKGIELAASGNR